jgi:starch synthase (maltosyl-transferring)
MLNKARRDHPALQQLRHLVVHSSDDENVLCFSKSSVETSGDEAVEDLVIVVVNLDPHAARETMVHLDLPALGLDWHDSLAVHDEVTGQDWHWGQHNYVRLDPYVEPAHLLTVRRTS